MKPIIQNRIYKPWLLTSLIFLLIFSFGLIWAILTPANDEAPDEAAHVNMVYFLKNHHRIPVFNHESGIVPTRYDPRIPSGAYYSMAYNSPVNYLPYLPLAISAQENFRKPNVLYMRLTSVFFIALFGVFLFLSLRLIKPAEWRAALAISIFIVLIPQVVFSASYVNIEPWALFLSSASFYFLLRNIKLNQNRWFNYLFFGLSAGLLGLAKANYYILLFYFLLLILFDLLRSSSKKMKIKSYLISALTFIVLNIWWWVRNIKLYNDPLIMNYIKNEIIGKAPSWLKTPALEGYNLATIFERPDFLKFTFLGFFANLGGASIFLPLWFYLFFFAALLILIVIAVKYLRRGQNTIFIWPFFLTLAVALIYFANKNLYDFSPQGRHLFPLLIPLSAVIFLGLASLKGVLQLISRVFLVLFSLIASIYSLWLLTDQYYVKGVAYSNLSNSGKVLQDFLWRPINFGKYLNLLNYITRDNPAIFGNIMLGFLTAILITAIILIFYFLLHIQPVPGSQEE